MFNYDQKFDQSVFLYFIKIKILILIRSLIQHSLEKYSEHEEIKNFTNQEMLIKIYDELFNDGNNASNIIIKLASNAL